MNTVEKFSKNIALRISKKLSMDKDTEEILAYGAFVLIQTIMTIVMLTIFGVIFDVLLEVLVISFVASILRKFSGGAHASSPINCAVISVLIFGGLALLLKYYVIDLDFLYLLVGQIVAFVYAYYVMFRYSPVDSPNKPIKNQGKRTRLKRISMKFVFALFIIDIILMIVYLYIEQINLLDISISISLGIVWQSLTMVNLGHKVMKGLDKLLRGGRRIGQT